MCCLVVCGAAALGVSRAAARRLGWALLDASEFAPYGATVPDVSAVGVALCEALSPFLSPSPSPQRGARSSGAPRRRVRGAVVAAAGVAPDEAARRALLEPLPLAAQRGVAFVALPPPSSAGGAGDSFVGIHSASSPAVCVPGASRLRLGRDGGSGAAYAPADGTLVAYPSMASLRAATAACEPTAADGARGSVADAVAGAVLAAVAAARAAATGATDGDAGRGDDGGGHRQHRSARLWVWVTAQLRRRPRPRWRWHASTPRRGEADPREEGGERSPAVVVAVKRRGQGT